MIDPGTVVPSPPRKQATPPAPVAGAFASDANDQPAAAVEHDGRLHAAGCLMHELPPHSLSEGGRQGRGPGRLRHPGHAGAHVMSWSRHR